MTHHEPSSMLMTAAKPETRSKVGVMKSWPGKGGVPCGPELMPPTSLSSPDAMRKRPVETGPSGPTTQPS